MLHIYSSMEKKIITLMKIDVNNETLILNQDCEKLSALG